MYVLLYYSTPLWFGVYFYDSLCDSTRNHTDFVGLQYVTNKIRKERNNLIGQPIDCHELCTIVKRGSNRLQHWAELKLNKHPNNRMVLSISWYWFCYTFDVCAYRLLCNKLKYKLVFVGIGTDLFPLVQFDLCWCTIWIFSGSLNVVGNVYFLPPPPPIWMWKIISIMRKKLVH